MENFKTESAVQMVKSSEKKLWCYAVTNAANGKLPTKCVAWSSMQIYSAFLTGVSARQWHHSRSYSTFDVCWTSRAKRLERFMAICQHQARIKLLCSPGRRTVWYKKSSAITFNWFLIWEDKRVRRPNVVLFPVLYIVLMLCFVDESEHDSH